MHTAPAPPAPIKKHSAALLPVWMILTLGIYWPFWLYRTYKDVRAHMPDATTITPGKAVGFLFIPFFNIYCFFRIVIDFPRAIARMQKSCFPQEELLPAGSVSVMIATGLILSTLSAYLHPALWFAGQMLVLTALVSCQQAMNAHSENHTRALRGQPIVTANGERSFARLIGVRGEKIEWRRVATLALSLAFTNPAFVIGYQLHLEFSAFEPFINLYLLLTYSLAMTGVAIVTLRYIKNYWLASLLACLIWTPLMLLTQKAMQSLVPHSFSGGLATGVVDSFLTLASLCVFVQVVRSVWVGLGLGMTFFMTASTAFWALIVSHRTFYVSIRSFADEVPRLRASLVSGAAFALVFWILTKYLVRPVRANV